VAVAVARGEPARQRQVTLDQLIPGSGIVRTPSPQLIVL
jgi:hypothetical protein